ncbi:hypothetical protein CFP56_037456 [Quercus suber]|uniref:Uncharacterized protein n=1 Tax=Quercus suber TaxID=58331 RepID=A0AAW0LN86_QUESU
MECPERDSLNIGWALEGRVSQDSWDKDGVRRGKANTLWGQRSSTHNLIPLCPNDLMFVYMILKEGELLLNLS